MAEFGVLGEWHGSCGHQPNTLEDRLIHAPSKRNALAAQILAYLVERPTAVDSARGVCEWWVGGKAPMDIAAVEAALQELAAEQLVRFEVLADGTRLWSAGPALVADASRNPSNQG